MALTDKIIGVESSGRRHAKNPRSSAYGPGQFISSTWLDMISRYRPDLKEGRTRAEILELRSDPDISREMTDAYARENATYLRSRGLPVDDGTVYLSHFAGPEGAESLLKNPNMRADQVLSAGAIKANPFLKDWTAQEVINWAARKMGRGSVKTEVLDDALIAKGKQMDPVIKSNSVSVPGDIARSTGYDETGGMLDNLFASSGGSPATVSIDLSGGSSEKIDGGRDMLVQTEAMNKQALAAMMQPRPQNVDMTRLAQILQRRASLGV